MYTPQYFNKLVLILGDWYKAYFDIMMLTKHYSVQINFFYVVLFLCLFQAKTGFILNFVGVITINIAINTWGAAMFQLNTFPSWANVTRAS